MELLFLIKWQMNMVVLFLLYKMLFQYRMHLQWRRYWLILSPVLAIGIAMIRIPMAGTYIVELPALPLNAKSGSDTATTTFDLPGLIYVAGMLIAAIYFAAKCILLIRKLPVARSQKYGDAQVIISEEVDAPFSFFRRIWMPADLEPDQREFILKHELVHVRQKHTLDLLWMECVHIFCWINPIMFLMKKELRLVHECLADREAARGNMAAYAELLVAISAVALPASAMVHTFIHTSQIKHRLMQLTQNRSIQAWPRMVAMVLCTLVLGLANACAENSGAQSSIGDSLTTLPEFKGGQAKLFEFIGATMHYPEESKKKGEEGTVYVEFTVKSNGKVTNATIKKGSADALNAEALRVINLMPDWEPGTSNGKAVDAQVVLPLKFMLSDK